MAVRVSAFGDPKELLLDPHRDRPASGANADTIHRPNRCNLGRGPREEDLIGNVQPLAQHGRFPHGDAQILAECHDHRSEEHTSELQSLAYLVCRLLLEKKKKTTNS